MELCRAGSRDREGRRFHQIQRRTDAGCGRTYGDDGAIHVVENRCSHRGVEFCRELTGNVKEFVCPYHQWTYELNGALRAVPFRRGVAGKGGMPATFDLAEHGCDV